MYHFRQGVIIFVSLLCQEVSTGAGGLDALPTYEPSFTEITTLPKHASDQKPMLHD